MEARIVLAMNDDRLGGRSTEVIATLEEEVRWIAGLPHAFWGLLAYIVGDGESPKALLSDTMHAALTMVSYLWRKTVLAMTSLPWCLLEGGDIDNNLRLLMQGPEPLDECSKKVWQCLNAGESWHHIWDAVMLWFLIPWSILLSEQAHGSMSVVRHYHHAYGYDTCMARSFLHMIWCVLNPCRVSGPMEKIVATLKRLAKRAPERASAQGQFLKQVHVCAKAQLPAGSDGDARMDCMKQVVSTHHHQYRHLDRDARNTTSL